MKLYKLTDSRNKTFGNTEWGNGVSHRSQRRKENLFHSYGTELCTADVIHAYTGPLIAVVMNRTHAAFPHPRMWVAEGIPVVCDGTKVGCHELTTIEEIPTPGISYNAALRAVISISLHYIDEQGELDGRDLVLFTDWARRWISGEDRSAYTARHRARKLSDDPNRDIEYHAVETVATVTSGTNYCASRLVGPYIDLYTASSCFISNFFSFIAQKIVMSNVVRSVSPYDFAERLEGFLSESIANESDGNADNGNR